MCTLADLMESISGISRIITQAQRANVALERLRYPGFSVRVRVVSSCYTDVCIIPSYFFCFLAIDNDIMSVCLSVCIMRKMCTLITSTDIDENIANQNHATRTRTPKPVYLNLSIVDGIASSYC